MSVKRLGVLLPGGLTIPTLIGWLLVGIAAGTGLVGDTMIEISYQGCSLSIDVQGARVSEVFKELAKRTPYEFIVPEDLLEHRVTLKCSGVDLDEGIRRIVIKAGADNYALVYGLREAKPGEGPLYRVKVVLIGGDFSGANGTSFQRSSFGKATERAPGVSTRPMPFTSGSFPEAREVPVPSERSFSGKTSVELAPRERESSSEEVPTPVVLSPENEDFPVYRTLENNQMPTKLQELTAP